MGEALTDVIEGPEGVQEHPGGSPANVALGLGRLGMRTSFLTALGPDERGNAIAARLRSSGVEILPQSWSLPVTSTAVARIKADGSAAYTFDLTWDIPAELSLPKVDHLHIGSIAAFIAPGADQVEKIASAHHADASVSFDPNIRSNLMGDPTEVLARFERLAAISDVVKLSDEDARFLYPDRTQQQAARTIFNRGRVVAVTTGAKGSILLSGADAVSIDPIITSVQDTVGAGDSYMSGLLTALLGRKRPRLRHLTASELLIAGTFAAQAAAITVSRAGAEPPTLADLQRANEKNLETRQK